MAERSYRWLLISLAVVGLTVDQVTKYRVFRWLYTDEPGGGSYEVAPGWFRLIAQFDPSTPFSDGGLAGLQRWSAPAMPRVNKGALFGIGNDGTGNNWFFLLVSFAAAAAILVWGLRRGPSRERWLCAALGLILGGTIGNLYDRIVFGGVRDFLHFYKIDWPVFNVADCCLVVGAALLLVQAVFVPPPPKPAADPVPPPADPAPPVGVPAG